MTEEGVMMAYMYILECADGTYYTGSTIDLEKRVWEHENFLGANYTKKKNPVKLVYFEEYARIDEAFFREKQVQGWSHAKKKALIEGRYNDIHELSECKNESHFRNAVASTTLSDQTVPRAESRGTTTEEDYIPANNKSPTTLVEPACTELCRSVETSDKPGRNS